MEKNGTIVRYTAEELDEMLEREGDKTDWDGVGSMSEEELEASIDVEEEGLPDWSSAIAGILEPK